MKLIVGRLKEIGEAVVQNSIFKLGAIIDVIFSILESYIPNLPSIQDVWKTGFDISVQECVTTLGGRNQ